MFSLAPVVFVFLFVLAPRSLSTLACPRTIQQIPQRDAQRMLEMAIGVSRGVLKNMVDGKAEFHRILAYCLGFKLHYRLPSQSKDEIQAFFVAQFRQHGNILKLDGLQAPAMIHETLFSSF